VGKIRLKDGLAVRGGSKTGQTAAAER